ncbi:hypothetical protein [Eupransor demetentiae]|uniref:Uncharacterized protein n=1 Tax=Eupransor demetentiae TaxID=3109584 RepID=A0ABM9N6N8_9LACO|nr:hypothetical protein R54876_GBNLAHCA_01475 [Lactobacillaceae bacterium LMG 33000]
MGAIKAVSKTAIAALLGLGLFTSAQANADSAELQPFSADQMANPLKPFTADSEDSTPAASATTSSVAKTDQGSGYTKPNSDVPFNNALTTASNIFGDKKVTNNQSNGVVSTPKDYANDVDAANDLRGITPINNMVTSLGKFTGSLHNLSNTNKQTEVTAAPTSITALGANSKDVNAAQFNTDGLTHTQLSNNGEAMDQYYDPATKALSLVLNGKVVTISNGDYTVATGADGKQYKIFNPGTGSALVQDEDFAEKKAVADESEKMTGNNIFPKLAVTAILGLDSVLQVISNVTVGIIDAIWTGINVVAYGLASIATATWFGALVGIPVQALVGASFLAQNAFRESWRLADRARRIALYSLIPALVSPAYLAQIINNYNTNRVANGTDSDNAANADQKAITEPDAVNGKANQASAASIMDAIYEGTFLGTEGVMNTATAAAWGLGNLALNGATFGVGALTAGLGAIPIAGGIAQAIGAPIAIAGAIAGSVAYDAENVADDARRAYNKSMLIGALWADGAARAADSYNAVVDAANTGDATVYKLA